MTARRMLAMTEDKTLVKRLRSNRPIPTLPHEAADTIEAQAAEIARMHSILEQWLTIAPEHLDTEVAGRTFEALLKEKTNDRG